MIVNCSYSQKKYNNFYYYVVLNHHCKISSFMLYFDDKVYELKLSLASFDVCQYLYRQQKVI